MLKPLEELFLVILKFFYQYVQDYGGYGTAIILLTVAVRLVLLPLDIGRTKSTKQMQKIQPKLKDIQQKHKKDKQKQQQEIAKLFSEHKVNPIGGCLPLLLQFPVFIALFVMLRDRPELAGTAFLWINDLSQKDVLYILPVLTVVTTFLSFQLTMTDAQQQKMMLIMTVPIGFISLNLPAGILVYWVTTNAWTLGQTYFLYAEERLERRASPTKGETPPDQSEDKKGKQGASKKVSVSTKGKGSRNGRPG